MTGPDFDRCLEVVEVPAAYEVWRERFEHSALWFDEGRAAVPRGDALVDRCVEYGFPDRGIQILADGRGSFDDDLLGRLAAHHQWTIAEHYHPATYLELGYPPPPGRCPLLFAYAALGLAGVVADDQRRAGIDPEVTRSTLWDIGQQVMLHERRFGVVEYRQHWWTSHHLGGWLFRLGALQFHLSVPGPDLGIDDPWFLDVHIPAGAPFDPASLDRSFAAAVGFFAERFPHHPVRSFGCSSWLLDPVLADLLPDGSNIVAFQRRFEITDVSDDWPSGVFEFVFDRPDLDGITSPEVESLPRSTTLERAVIDTTRAGAPIRRGAGHAGV